MATATADSMATATASPGMTAGEERSGNTALVGTLLFVGAGAMLLAGLGGAYLTVRGSTGKVDFIPEEMKFDNYGASMLSMTALLAAMAAEWAMSSVRMSHRRWSLMGWTLAAFMMLCLTNGVWYLGRNLGFGVADSSYAVLVYALFTVAGALAIAGTIGAVLGLVRTAGGQINSAQPSLGRASAWVVHLGAAAWIVCHLLVYLKK